MKSLHKTSKDRFASLLPGASSDAIIAQRNRAEIESKVIFEIIQGVSTTPNLEELLALVQRSIGQAIYAENFYVALYDKETELFQVPFCVDKFDTVAPPQKLGRGLTAYALRRALPTLLTSADVDRLCEQGEVESVGTSSAIWLGIPLRTPAGIIGVLVVQHYEDASVYTTRDIDLLSSAAGQIALAIQRKRAEDTLRESEANLAASQSNLVKAQQDHDRLKPLVEQDAAASRSCVLRR